MKLLELIEESNDTTLLQLIKDDPSIIKEISTPTVKMITLAITTASWSMSAEKGDKIILWIYNNNYISNIVMLNAIKQHPTIVETFNRLHIPIPDTVIVKLSTSKAAPTLMNSLNITPKDPYYLDFLLGALVNSNFMKWTQYYNENIFTAVLNLPENIFKTKILLNKNLIINFISIYQNLIKIYFKDNVLLMNKWLRYAKNLRGDDE